MKSIIKKKIDQTDVSVNDGYHHQYLTIIQNNNIDTRCNYKRNIIVIDGIESIIGLYDFLGEAIKLIKENKPK